jgi:RHS repeat-associated protein
MEKKSGVDAVGRSLPTGGGAQRNTGEQFQPNLAMGGGSYKLPFDLPLGPGGFAPKLELLYNTGFGNGPFGMGWRLAQPFIEQKLPSRFDPAPESAYSLSGSETLVPLGGGRYVPYIQQAHQPFAYDGDHWTSTAPDLTEMRFGVSSASRIAGPAGVIRWLLDRVTFPGGREVTFAYDADGAQRYLRRVSWSVFRLELLYETRPDPFSDFSRGIELRTARRCHRMELHQDRLAPDTLMRTYDLTFSQAEHTGATLLERFQVTGWQAGAAAALPPITFGYTGFSPATRRIEKFRSTVVPPPALGDDVTLLDYQGTALPGIIRMDGREATYWENRGGLLWGPPQRLPHLPMGVHLSHDRVRFADLTGNGTADLVLAETGGGQYFPNDPAQGFMAGRRLPLAPGFALDEEGTYLVDLDGDKVSDLLTFRGGTPMAFLNRGGEAWSAPVVLSPENLPPLNQSLSRLRMADMNGDGLPDLVLLQSRQVVYWPYLGDGRWGERRVVANTPEFAVPDPDQDVHLADVDGDGTADLVLVGSGVVRIYPGQGGESFGPPIELKRTPRLGAGRFLLTDLTGSGTAGFLWTTESGAAGAHEYWYLDLLGGVKPYLLSSISNGAGLSTQIEYSTSVRERTADLAAGRRWSGYLPFAVHVVKRMTVLDSVSGEAGVTEYTYHDGHFDGAAREYLGFAEVASRQAPTAHEAAIRQRYYFHNRTATARDPAFQAGKGQPHRTELLDDATLAVLRLDESTWEAHAVTTAHPEFPAYLALERVRSSRRLQGGAAYESEQSEFAHDAIGNVTEERRTSAWTDTGGVPQTAETVIRNDYATHPVHGLTSIRWRLRQLDGAGRLLKEQREYFDGPDYVGLPAGQVERGFLTRRTEVILTQAEIDEAYGGSAPALLGTLYRTEADPAYGTVYVRDTLRCRHDAFGNQLATIDALGRKIAITYDAEAIHPTAISEGGGPARIVAYDPVAQQMSVMEDLNGNLLRVEFDGLGNITAVYRRGALPGLPTETYQYCFDQIPTLVIEQQRVQPDDAAPGYVKYEYRDGAGKTFQVKRITETGAWAVGKQEVRSAAGRLIRERDGYFAATPGFDPAPHAGVAERELFYDQAGRLIQEQLFSGAATVYHYDGPSAQFYGPEAAAALAADPAAPPTRISRTDPAGQIIAISERDGAGTYEQRREYDGLGRLTRIRDPLGHIALESLFDLVGNRIRVRSAESGITTFIYDAAGNEVLRLDADGRSVYQPRDDRGRVQEVRYGGPGGSLEETYIYDAGPGQNLNGRLTRVEGTFGTAEYSYSVEGDPVAITRTFAGNPASYTVSFEYNQQRHVTAVAYPDGARVEYQYHANGVLAAIPGYIDAIEYGPTGKRQRVIFANGLHTVSGHTPGDRLLRELLTEPVAGGPRYQHLVHHLDGMGQVTRIDDLSSVAGKIRNNQTFEYDARNRLTRATGRGADGDYDFTYQYDALGNLRFSGESFAEEMEYGHQLGDPLHPNRLIKRKAAAGPEYEYDAAGNLTRDPSLGQLFYDARHRLMRIERPDGAIFEYRYDHNDLRTEARCTTADAGTQIRYEVEGLYLVEPDGAAKVVMDEKRRLAILPEQGDPLLHHLDRLGNVNVLSNLATGAFVGHDEYTPYGKLSVSVLIQPHYSFQGGRFCADLGIVLLGVRFYRPELGRFLTPDPYLALKQDEVVAIHSAANLYLYALANPVNVTDPTGQIAFLAVLLIAAIVGAALGVIGAGVNGATTFSEWFLWIVGGAIGGVLTALTGGALAFLFAGAGAAVTGAITALTIWSVASLLGSFFGPTLDNSNSPVAWAFSFLLKWIQSPILTTIGLIVAAVAAMAGQRVDFRRGALFVEMGPGTGALTLGAVVYTMSGHFDANGRVQDDFAKHEAYHSRQVVALGELGFYVTYLTVGFLWAVAETGLPRCWNTLNSSGGGNPFEKGPHREHAGPTCA